MILNQLWPGEDSRKRQVIRYKNRLLKIENDLTNRPLALLNIVKTYSQTLQINKYLTTFLCRKIISNDTKKNL
jgi:hypothetical protein